MSGSNKKIAVAEEQAPETPVAKKRTNADDEYMILIKETAMGPYYSQFVIQKSKVPSGVWETVEKWSREQVPTISNNDLVEKFEQDCERLEDKEFAHVRKTLRSFDSGTVCLDGCKFVGIAYVLSDP